MAVKISKISVTSAKNCKIHPVLYKYFLRLKDTLGAEIVHRRKRSSSMCIEIIFRSAFINGFEHHVNTLKEAEECGFWVICRKQTKRGHTSYKDHQVYQLFLSPVHPHKRRESVPEITPLSSVASDSRMANVS